MNSIPRPVVGRQISAQWGSDVTDVCNAVRNAGMPGMLTMTGAGAFGNSPLPENNRNRRGSHAAHPYQVRWSSKANKGAGGWQIYLPINHDCSDFAPEQGTELLMLYNLPVKLFFPEASSDGWEGLGEIPREGGPVYLTIVAHRRGLVEWDIGAKFSSIPKTEEEVKEDLGEAYDNEADLLVVYNIPIASCKAEFKEGDDGEEILDRWSVDQFVVGALHLQLPLGKDAGDYIQDPDGTDPDRTDPAPLPYEVRWSRGDGCWAIWLTGSSLYVNKHTVNLTANLAPATDKELGGWYIVPEANEGILYLVVKAGPSGDEDEDPGVPTARLSCQPGEYDEYTYVVAYLTKAGDDKNRGTLIQNLVGALVLNIAAKGYTGDTEEVTGIRYGLPGDSSGRDTESDYAFWQKKVTKRYEKGLLISVSDETEAKICDTTPISQELEPYLKES